MDADVVVIGSGQAGVPLATRLAKTGKKVVILERADFGGSCINTGCTPTKTIIASAEAAHSARRASRFGVHVGEVRVDLEAVVARKDRIVGEWREGIEASLRDAKGVTVVKAAARFVAAKEIAAGGGRYRAPTIVINVGTRPVVPPIKGLDAVPWLDNARLLDLRKLPEHLLVVGGGYIGCELGQAYRRFGSRVTMFDPGQHLMGRVDGDVSSALEQAFREEGITLEFGAKVESVSGAEGRVTVHLNGGRSVEGSHLLIATGRRPNTDDLGLDAAGIPMDARGFVKVDERYETSVKGVYAVGDCNGQPQFTHTAWDDHRILFDLLTGASERGRAGRTIPWVAFTDPQVAGVGLSEREAKEQGLDVEVATMPFGNIARAAEVDRPGGLLKVLLDRKTERLVGAVFVGAEAGELLHILVPFFQAGTSPRPIVETQFAHPTYAEGLQALIMKLERFQLS